MSKFVTVLGCLFLLTAGFVGTKTFGEPNRQCAISCADTAKSERIQCGINYEELLKICDEFGGWVIDGQALTWNECIHRAEIDKELCIERTKKNEDFCVSQCPDIDPLFPDAPEPLEDPPSDEKCKGRCDELYNDMMLDCNIEYLVDLMTCKADMDCLDDAEKKYNDCTHNAGKIYLSCYRACESPEW